MGSNQSVGCKQIKLNISHPKFKNAKICNQNSISKLVSQLTTQQKIYKQWQKQLSKYDLKGQFLLLPQKSDFKNQGLCSNSGNVQITYACFPYQLKSQIHDRAGKIQNFNEQQLWYLLFAIFSAKKQFSSKKINHGSLGNVTPQNVFLNQKGQIKIANILSWPGQQQANKKVTSQDHQRFFAPEDFVQLSLGMSYCKNTIQSEIFSIGLTLLSAGILKDCKELYNFSAKKFNFNETLLRIQLWKASLHYSDVLKATVQLLCAFDSKDRLKSSQVQQIIFRFYNCIRLKKEFSIYPLAKKIEQKIEQNRRQLKILPIQINQICPQKQKSITASGQKLFNVNLNSLNLTQVILGIRPYLNEHKSQNSESLISSGQEFIMKKMSSDIKVDRPLQRYQQINANQGLTSSISEFYFGNLANLAKQIIIQKPIIVDKKRKSDDIQQETTPVQTPTQTPGNRSQVSIGQQRGFNRNFHIPTLIGPQSLNIIEKGHIQKNDLNHLYSQIQLKEPRFKVKQTKSQNIQADIQGRQQIHKTQTSMITIYIPLQGQIMNHSLKSLQSQTKVVKKSLGESSKKKMSIFPEGIRQLSRQGSQIQIHNLTQQDQNQIEEKLLQKIPIFQQISQTNQIIVKYQQNIQILDISHQSKILEIDDIDFDFLEQKELQKNSHKLFVGYREPKQSQIIIQSVKISINNSKQFQNSGLYFHV